VYVTTRIWASKNGLQSLLSLLKLKWFVTKDIISIRMSSEEVWKEVKGYEGYYWVSDQGRVKSKFKILNGYARKDGRLYIVLSSLGNRLKYYIHRLVAEHYVEGYSEGKVVDHIDRNHLNNMASNLRWVTQRENCWNRTDKKNSTGYKHVTKRGERYTFTISRTFGSYATAEEAHEAALKYLETEDKAYNMFKHMRTDTV
jgi:hypothetical protein